MLSDLFAITNRKYKHDFSPQNNTSRKKWQWLKNKMTLLSCLNYWLYPDVCQPSSLVRQKHLHLFLSKLSKADIFGPFCIFVCVEKNGPVTRSLRAGTEARWRWNNPPRNPAGTRRWASPLALSSSRLAWAHGGTRDTRQDTASCSPAPPGPTPPGSPYLADQNNTTQTSA